MLHLLKLYFSYLFTKITKPQKYEHFYEFLWNDTKELANLIETSHHIIIDCDDFIEFIDFIQSQKSNLNKIKNGFEAYDFCEKFIEKHYLIKK